MVEGNLDTTNLLLGILAAVSVLEALVIIALGVMAYKAYSKAMQIVHDVEVQAGSHAADIGVGLQLPARRATTLTTVRGKIAALVPGKFAEATFDKLAEAKDVSQEVDGVTADHVRSSVAHRMQRVVGVMRGVRVAMDTLFHTENGHNGHGRQAARDYRSTSQTAGETRHG